MPLDVKLEDIPADSEQIGNTIQSKTFQASFYELENNEIGTYIQLTKDATEESLHKEKMWTRITEESKILNIVPSRYVFNKAPLSKPSRGLGTVAIIPIR